MPFGLATATTAVRVSELNVSELDAVNIDVIDTSVESPSAAKGAGSSSSGSKLSKYLVTTTMAAAAADEPIPFSKGMQHFSSQSDLELTSLSSNSRTQSFESKFSSPVSSKKKSKSH